MASDDRQSIVTAEVVRGRPGIGADILLTDFAGKKVAYYAPWCLDAGLERLAQELAAAKTQEILNG